MLKNVKVGDILIVYPSKNRVKVINITAKKKSIPYKEFVSSYKLKDYWKERYRIILPKTFRIVTCQFATTPYKEYDYPLYRKCVRKPFGQYGHKKMWESARQYSLFKKGKTIAEILNVNQEDLSKAREEMSDNKGNWHPPSDYTMYQMGF